MQPKYRVGQIVRRKGQLTTSEITEVKKMPTPTTVIDAGGNISYRESEEKIFYKVPAIANHLIVEELLIEVELIG